MSAYVNQDQYVTCIFSLDEVEALLENTSSDKPPQVEEERPLSDGRETIETKTPNDVRLDQANNSTGEAPVLLPKEAIHESAY